MVDKSEKEEEAEIAESLFDCELTSVMDSGVFIKQCKPANIVNRIFYFLMIAFGCYFTVSALCILLVPLFKGYTSIG